MLKALQIIKILLEGLRLSTQNVDKAVEAASLAFKTWSKTSTK